MLKIFYIKSIYCIKIIYLIYEQDDNLKIININNFLILHDGNHIKFLILKKNN